MESNPFHLIQAIKIQRFPTSSDRSLKAYSSADVYLLEHISKHLSPTSSVAVINDRFGYLSLSLLENSPLIYTHYKSQEDAILKNGALNDVHLHPSDFKKFLQQQNSTVDLIVLKVPKTMDLFHLFLITACNISHSESKIFCGFMTKHFTKQMVEIASMYFEDVHQSLAWKKSRVLTLSLPKKHNELIVPIRTILFENHLGQELKFRQYFGVFSGKHIDYATQFLLKHLDIESEAQKILDLASGNGVIAHAVRNQLPSAEIHLVDDSWLAVESSKMNVVEGDNHFHYSYHLSDFKVRYFDWVICNPPFHFEHENTIDIALQLFRDVKRVLAPNGKFLIVSNRHLNYKTHLSKMYKKVEVLQKNSKFEILLSQHK